MIGLVLLFGCAPMALSDDEDLLLDGAPSATSDDAAAGGAEAAVQGWQTDDVDAGGSAHEQWSAGTLEARRVGQDVACTHAGMSLPCGALAQSMGADEGGVAMTYDVVPSADGAWCAWSASYTLTGVPSDAGAVVVVWTLEGAVIEGVSTRAEYGSVAVR